MDWQGAEGWYQHMSSARAEDQNAIPNKFFEPESQNEKLPDIVNADHYGSRDTKQYSFPLLAMQFMLRHFVRCTDFCLVCHQKLEGDVEAIKPYVCDRGLCLFQLLSLGFGPSIEHEVMAQPYVVDLLVSFCYNSAAARKLKSFPDGLDLMVPPIDSSAYNVVDPMAAYRVARTAAQQPAARPPVAKKEYPTHKVRFNQSTLELMFESGGGETPVRRGMTLSPIFLVSNLLIYALHLQALGSYSIVNLKREWTFTVVSTTTRSSPQSPSTALSS